MFQKIAANQIVPTHLRSVLKYSILCHERFSTLLGTALVSCQLCHVLNSLLLLNFKLLLGCLGTQKVVMDSHIYGEELQYTSCCTSTYVRA